MLYAKESPRAAENFRAMCTGERPRYSFKGMKFYRIIDMFIDQSGSHSAPGSIWGGSFDDDQADSSSGMSGRVCSPRQTWAQIRTRATFRSWSRRRRTSTAATPSLARW